MKYRKTNDPKKMMTAKELYDARDDYESIYEFFPCRSATYIEYEARATEAFIWTENNPKRIKVYLPPEDGWYLVDEHGIPNGEKSNRDNPNTLYLYRHQDRSFSGPLGRGYDWFVDGGRRGVFARGDWSIDFGVEKIKDSIPKSVLLKWIDYRQRQARSLRDHANVDLAQEERENQEFFKKFMEEWI
jgi:hypothetical protein